MVCRKSLYAAILMQVTSWRDVWWNWEATAPSVPWLTLLTLLKSNDLLWQHFLSPIKYHGFLLSFPLKGWPFNFEIPSQNYWQFPFKPLYLNLPCLIWFISWFPKYPQKDFWHPPENLPSLVADESLTLSSHLRIIALNSLICDISPRSEANRCFKLLGLPLPCGWLRANTQAKHLDGLRGVLSFAVALWTQSYATICLCEYVGLRIFQYQ